MRIVIRVNLIFLKFQMGIGTVTYSLCYEQIGDPWLLSSTLESMGLEEIVPNDTSSSINE